MVELKDTLVMKPVPDHKLKESLIVEPLDTDQATQQPFDDFFTCNVCLNVVHRPVQCQSCENIHCEACIRQWTASKKSVCPRCNKNYVKAPSVNRFVINTLDAKEFKCKGCDATFSYGAYGKHLQACPSALYQCPLGCGQTGIKGTTALNAHIESECARAVYECTECGAQVSGDKRAKHNCWREKIEMLENLLKSTNLEMKVRV